MADFNQFMSDPAIQMALGSLGGILQASGPSRMPISRGQVFGQGLLGMQQGYMQAIQNGLLADKIVEARKKKEDEQKLKDAIGTTGQTYIPGSGMGPLENIEGTGFLGGKIPLEGLLATAAYADPKTGLAGLVDLEGKRISAANAAERSPYYQFLPTAEGYAVGNARSGEIMPPGSGMTPIIPAQFDPSLQGRLAGAKESGKVAGGAQTQAAIDLPIVENAANQTIQLVKDIVNHPGKKWAVGFGAGNLPQVAGTSQSDFIERLNQIKGKQFLEAYQLIKGSGQISNVEGEKAEKAISRMSRAQSVDEFDKAATEFIGVVEKAKETAKLKAGMKDMPKVNIAPNNGFTIRRLP